MDSLLLVVKDFGGLPSPAILWTDAIIDEHEFSFVFINQSKKKDKMNPTLV